MRLLTTLLLADASSRFEKGGPGSGPHPGAGKTPGKTKPQWRVKRNISSYNHTKNRDEPLRAGTILTHVGGTDKGEIFRHEGTGDEHSVDSSQTGPKDIERV